MKASFEQRFYYGEEDVQHFERIIRLYKSKKGIKCDELIQSLFEALRKCRATIIYITDEICGSEWAKLEIDHFKSQKMFV